MNTELSQEQVNRYNADGFIRISEFLSAPEVQELKGAVSEAIESMGQTKVAGRNDPEEWSDGDAYYDFVFRQRLNLWRINKTVKRYMLSPELGKMVCTLSGVQGARVWHDQALIKEAFSNPTPWHLDDPIWSFYSRQAITIWVALEDATLGNGCMWFIPGSHLLASFDKNAFGENVGDLFKLYPEMGKVDPVAAPMKAGDCSFHNGLCAHGAGANMTRGRRIALTCAYMPEGSVFNGQKNILPKHYFDSLRQGDLLDNEDWNPIVYRR